MSTHACTPQGFEVLDFLRGCPRCEQLVHNLIPGMMYLRRETYVAWCPSILYLVWKRGLCTRHQDLEHSFRHRSRKRSDLTSGQTCTECTGGSQSMNQHDMTWCNIDSGFKGCATTGHCLVSLWDWYISLWDWYIIFIHVYQMYHIYIYVSTVSIVLVLPYTASNECHARLLHFLRLCSRRLIQVCSERNQPFPWATASQFNYMNQVWSTQCVLIVWLSYAKSQRHSDDWTCYMQWTEKSGMRRSNLSKVDRSDKIHTSS